MSLTLLVVAMVAAVNPARARAGAPDRLDRVAPLVAMGTTTVTVTVLAMSASFVLDGLAISPETFLIAAGLVAIATALHGLWVEPVREPSLSGWKAGVWPLAYPLTITPAVLAFGIALPDQRSVAAVVGAGLLGAVFVALLARLVPGANGRRVLVAAGRLTAVILLAVGVWLMIEGIRDV